MGFSPQLIYEFTDSKFAEKCKTFYKMVMDRSSKIDIPHLKDYYTNYYSEQFHILESVNFDTKKLWKDNNWEILAYPSTHCVLPLVTEKVITHFFDEGEAIIKEYFDVDSFSGVWLPEMAFDGHLGIMQKILAERYEYIFGNWKTVEGYGSANRLYKDFKTGLKIVVRNSQSIKNMWGDESSIAGLPNYRETFKTDIHRNKIYRINGGTYHPEDGLAEIDNSLRISSEPLNREVGQYLGLMFDTEYFGHHWWEGKYYLPRFIESYSDRLQKSSYLAKELAGMDIDLRSAQYSWGSTGEKKGNGNLDPWINSKTYNYLKLYHDVSKRFEVETSKNNKDLRIFFSSDWLFNIYYKSIDIEDKSFDVVRYSEYLINHTYKKLLRKNGCGSDILYKMFGYDVELEGFRESGMDMETFKNYLNSRLSNNFDWYELEEEAFSDISYPSVLYIEHDETNGHYCLAEKIINGKAVLWDNTMGYGFADVGDKITKSGFKYILISKEENKNEIGEM